MHYLTNFKSIIFIAILLCLTAAVFYFFPRSNATQTQLEEAYNSYIKGEQAKTVAVRKDAFNKALSLYSELESQYAPHYGNGKLFYNIGNTYFQLEQYPQAIYYYYNALALMPTNETVKQDISVASAKLDLPPPPPDSIFKKVFFFYSYLSLPDRLRAFFFCAIAALLFFSAAIWVPSRFWKALGTLFAILSVLFLATVFYSRYWSPIEAIAVKSTLLYRDAGTEYAHVKEQPLLCRLQSHRPRHPEGWKLVENLNARWYTGLCASGVPAAFVKLGGQ